MRTALSDYNALDWCATTLARLPLLVIDKYMIVVVSSFSPQVAILTERCPSMLYGLRQYRDYTLVQ